MLQDDTESLLLFRLCYQGRVQGLGFRPLLWRLAHTAGLAGEIRNITRGVEVLLWATPAQIESFIGAVATALPPLAQIEALSVDSINGTEWQNKVSTSGVYIKPSEQGSVQTPILPDLATCSHCLKELFDPENRRYRYPFINCTDCGPRYSVIHTMPFDRERTAYSDFPMCQSCREEFEAAENRRFHAQGNVCQYCGPELWLEDALGQRVSADDPFQFLAERLSRGDILAIKGIGGFHLCCDAGNAESINRLRALKNRPEKALALMFSDLESVRRYAEISEQEAQCLRSAQAPIVLCRKRCDPPEYLPENIAPDSHELGVMLPYTPIHHLLLAAFAGPLVMTSGNVSGQPQAISNEDAREQLSKVADCFLMHSREILHRVDDAVVRVGLTTQGRQVLRPGRGTAPLTLSLPEGFSSTHDPVMAVGGDLKNTLCLISDGECVISPYLGDLSQPQIFQSWQKMLQHYHQLYSLDQPRLVTDLHPGYLSTQWAQSRQGRSQIQVQHHHAHLASCLLDNAYPLMSEPVLALCLDGSGYGEDGSLWGGECLLGHYSGSIRLASLKSFALPGGSAAIRQPWRLLVSQLGQAGIDMKLAIQAWPLLRSKPVSTLVSMIEQGVNSPESSSIGRLFDAMAAALGCYAEGISYEGQAAIKLEQLAWQCDASDAVEYDLPWLPNHEGLLQLETRYLWRQVLHDVHAARAPEEMAWAFHKGLTSSFISLIERLAKQKPFRHVVLTGGVMQNRLLSEGLIAGIEQLGLSALVHRHIPCNDSGISAGQAIVALAQIQTSSSQQFEGAGDA